MKSLVNLSVILLSLFVFSSCQKEQKVVNKLEGNWEVVTKTTNGAVSAKESYAGTTYYFIKCKSKNGSCDGIFTERNNPTPFHYNITEDGDRINIFISDFYVIVGEIEELGEDIFVFTYRDVDAEYTVTLERTD